MNPYLRGHAPAHFGNANPHANYTPAPGAYFGGMSPAQYYPNPGNYFGAQHHGFVVAQGACPPMTVEQLCPPDPCPPYGLQGARLAQLASMVRHPLGQWPNMPALSGHATQNAAALTVAGAQLHADALRLAYGVDSGAAPLIGIGLSATITVTPQKRHIPEKLVMSEAMASNFLITGIFAGVEPVLATTGPISSAMFVQDSTVSPFKSVIMDVGMDFSIGVTNISGATARFTTGVIGKPIPPGL